MRTAAIGGHAATLARALRLEDLIANAAAIPLPIDVMPSAVPQLSSGADERVSEINDGSSHEALPRSPPSVVALHPHAEVIAIPDSLTSSLETARAAIHHSLLEPTADTSSVAPAAATATSDQAVPPVEPAVAVGGPPLVPNLVVSAHDAAATLVSMASHPGAIGVTDFTPVPPQINVDVPNIISTLPWSATDHTNNFIATSVAGGDGAVLVQMGAALKSVAPTTSLSHDVGILTGGSTDPLALASIVHEGSAGVNDVMGATAAVVGNALTSASLDGMNDADASGIAAPAAIARDLRASIGHDLGNSAPPAVAASDLPSVDALLSTAAPAHPNTEIETVADTVTVPSMHGTGFDSLAGILPPAVAPAAIAAAPVTAGTEDHSLLSPIGLDDALHHDAASAHAVHALLPAAGSGLI